MLAVYWALAKPALNWPIAVDPNAHLWQEMFDRGSKYVNPQTGIPLRKIPSFLDSLELPLKMKVVPLHGTYTLEYLLKANIPPIVIFDLYFYHKGVIKNPFHAAVVMEITAENVLTVDPSFPGKSRTAYYRLEFEKAWQVVENHAIIMYPENYRLNVKERTGRPLETFGSA
jgi:hypothetical protein